MDDLDEALDAVVASLRAHAAAVRTGGDVAAAVRAFDDAADAYEEALSDIGSAAPWVAAYDAAPAVPAAGERIAVRVRADFVVTDLAAVLEAGTAARRRTTGDPAAPPCAGVGEVVYELVRDAGPVLRMLDVPGLERDGALLVVHRAPRQAPASVDDLAVADDEEPVFELAERWE